MNSMFGLNGIGGNLIAVALLLSIVGVFTFMAISIQSETAVKPYAFSGSKVANPTTKEDVWANLQDVKTFDETANGKRTYPTK
jgi:hypothetical protein